MSDSPLPPASEAARRMARIENVATRGFFIEPNDALWLLAEISRLTEALEARLVEAKREARPAPSDCQHEPPFPGVPTVLASLSAPDLTAHHGSDRCAIEGPHAIAECGEFRTEGAAQTAKPVASRQELDALRSIMEAGQHECQRSGFQRWGIYAPGGWAYERLDSLLVKLVAASALPAVDHAAPCSCAALREENARMERQYRAAMTENAQCWKIINGRADADLAEQVAAIRTVQQEPDLERIDDAIERFAQARHDATLANSAICPTRKAESVELIRSRNALRDLYVRAIDAARAVLSAPASPGCSCTDTHHDPNCTLLTANIHRSSR